MNANQRMWLEEALRRVESARAHLNGPDGEEPAADAVYCARADLVSAATEIRDTLAVTP